MPGLVALKAVLTISILCLGLLSVFAPRKLAGSPSLFSLGNTMASGVLLSAGLVHQLADSAEALNKPGQFPWSMFIAGLTFLIFLVTEESLHLVIEGSDHKNHHQEAEHPAETQLLLRTESCASAGSKRRVSSCFHEHHDECKSSSVRSVQVGAWVQSTKSNSEDPCMPAEHHHHDDHLDLHLHGSVLASFILMMALSVHSIMAGISIGIDTSVGSVTSTAVAILAHKLFEGFCLGSSLVNSQLEHHVFYIFGIGFASATPLGILIGYAISSTSGSMKNSTVAVVQAIVAGTFLYISIVEIGSKELLVCRNGTNADSNCGQHKHVEAMKLICFLLGFLSMSYLAVFV